MLSSVVSVLLLAAVSQAHILISYPGWRGNNFITNATFPYGMQWMFPCGGLTVTQNRTYWPTTGGAIAFQPGWFQGHSIAQLYVNLGYGTDGPDGGPPNMTFNMVPAFQILGPSKGPFPGTICLPQIPLPVNASVKAGDKATIQVVELAQHGAALFSCVDIIFAEPGDKRIPEVNETNCFNSNDIGFADMYAITTKEPTLDTPPASGAEESVTFYYFGRNRSANSWVSLGWVPLVLGGLWLML